MIAGPIALVVLDGWGVSDETEGNAIALARKPNMDRFLALYPNTTLRTHGEAVGLLGGQMGNSNVGHLNLGAGRVVLQDFTRIHRAVESGNFFHNSVLTEAMESAKSRGRIHLLGLLSDGGVHSHIDHIFALLDMARRRGVGRVFIHTLLDGRDTAPRSAELYLTALQSEAARLGVGEIATVTGRYFGMDRDQRWDRTEKAYRVIVRAEGRLESDPLQAVAHAYERGESDEFIEPTVITGDDGGPIARVEPGDTVIFFNFRADRARQLIWALGAVDFDGFERGEDPCVDLVTMTRYDERLPVPAAFPREHLRNTLGEIVSRKGRRQLRIAETEKYAHVTYFFNGGNEEVFPGEERILIPSPRVATYDQQPEMSAREVTDRLLEAMEEHDYRLIVLNYANPDMVGHTGNIEAAVRAIETVDECLGRVEEAILRRGGAMLIVADHGNAEQMIDRKRNQAHTAHTSNPVPCILIADGTKGWRLRPGFLADVAPTVLYMMELPLPPEMNGHSLIVHEQPVETNQEVPHV